jgi:DNA polymerase-4
VNILYKTILQLSEKVGYRLRKKGLQGRTIHLKLRYENFSTITRNKTLASAIDSTQVLFSVIKELFDNNYQQGRKVRLLGVGISGFKNEEGDQLSLFDNQIKKHDRLDQLQDALTNRFGKHIISRAESLNGNNHYDWD